MDWFGSPSSTEFPPENSGPAQMSRSQENECYELQQELTGERSECEYLLRELQDSQAELEAQQEECAKAKNSAQVLRQQLAVVEDCLDEEEFAAAAARNNKSPQTSKRRALIRLPSRIIELEEQAEALESEVNAQKNESSQYRRESHTLQKSECHKILRLQENNEMLESEMKDARHEEEIDHKHVEEMQEHDEEIQEDLVVCHEELHEAVEEELFEVAEVRSLREAHVAEVDHVEFLEERLHFYEASSAAPRRKSSILDDALGLGEPDPHDHKLNSGGLGAELGIPDEKWKARERILLEELEVARQKLANNGHDLKEEMWKNRERSLVLELEAAQGKGAGNEKSNSTKEKLLAKELEQARITLVETVEEYQETQLTCEDDKSEALRFAFNAEELAEELQNEVIDYEETLDMAEEELGAAVSAAEDEAAVVVTLRATTREEVDVLGQAEERIRYLETSSRKNSWQVDFLNNLSSGGSGDSDDPLSGRSRPTSRASSIKSSRSLKSQVRGGDPQKISELQKLLVASEIQDAQQAMRSHLSKARRSSEPNPAAVRAVNNSKRKTRITRALTQDDLKELAKRKNKHSSADELSQKSEESMLEITKLRDELRETQAELQSQPSHKSEVRRKSTYDGTTSLLQVPEVLLDELNQELDELRSHHEHQNSEIVDMRRRCNAACTQLQHQLLIRDRQLDFITGRWIEQQRCWQREEQLVAGAFLDVGKRYHRLRSQMPTIDDDRSSFFASTAGSDEEDANPSNSTASRLRRMSSEIPDLSSVYVAQQAVDEDGEESDGSGSEHYNPNAKGDDSVKETEKVGGAPQSPRAWRREQRK